MPLQLVDDAKKMATTTQRGEEGTLFMEVDPSADRAVRVPITEQVHAISLAPEHAPGAKQQRARAGAKQSMADLSSGLNAGSTSGAVGPEAVGTVEGRQAGNARGVKGLGVGLLVAAGEASTAAGMKHLTPYLFFSLCGVSAHACTLLHGRVSTNNLNKVCGWICLTVSSAHRRLCIGLSEFNNGPAARWNSDLSHRNISAHLHCVPAFVTRLMAWLTSNEGGHTIAPVRLAGYQYPQLGGGRQHAACSVPMECVRPAPHAVILRLGRRANVQHQHPNDAHALCGGRHHERHTQPHQLWPPHQNVHRLGWVAIVSCSLLSLHLQQSKNIYSTLPPAAHPATPCSRLPLRSVFPLPCAGNLTEGKSVFEPQLGPPPQRTFNTSPTSSPRFGPSPGAVPFFALTLDWFEIQGTLMNTAGWWDPQAMGPAPTQHDPSAVLRAALEQCSLSVQVMKDSGNLYVGVQSREVWAHDVRERMAAVSADAATAARTDAVGIAAADVPIITLACICHPSLNVLQPVMIVHLACLESSEPIPAL